MIQLSNIPFSEIAIGQTARYTKSISQTDIRLFAKISGDVNPVHLDEDFAAQTNFGGCIAHGMLSGAVVSAALATVLPGPGAIYRSQSLKFTKPVKPDDQLTVNLDVIDKKEINKPYTEA